MKSYFRRFVRLWKMSLPARGAWIEIPSFVYVFIRYSSLPARGAWIEIGEPAVVLDKDLSRSPQGERGLKYRKYYGHNTTVRVAPRKGSVD